jgi:hypothetical protein
LKLSLKQQTEPGLEEHACGPSYSATKVKGSQFEASSDKISSRSYLKNKLKQKKAVGMAQVVEYLPSK